MLNEAVSKIKVEMERKNDDPYVQVVGEFLLGYLKDNPGSAEQFMDPEKSIEKSLDEMRKAAEKKKKGTCAVLTDAEGFAIVLKYYGIELAQGGLVEPAAKPKVDFDVDLDDLLKG
jgi:hypothetical protein